MTVDWGTVGGAVERHSLVGLKLKRFASCGGVERAFSVEALQDDYVGVCTSMFLELYADDLASPEVSKKVVRIDITPEFKSAFWAFMKGCRLNEKGCGDAGAHVIVHSFISASYIHLEW